MEYTGADKRVSPATVELLIRERSKDKSLRQLGQMFDRSHEGIRQLLAEYGPPLVTLLPEATVAAKLGCPVQWLARLRKERIVKPIKPGGSGFTPRSKSGKYHHLLLSVGKTLIGSSGVLLLRSVGKSIVPTAIL